MRTGRNAESTEYDAFTSRDLRDITKMLGFVMKPAAYGHVFLTTSFRSMLQSSRVLIYGITYEYCFG